MELNQNPLHKNEKTNRLHTVADEYNLVDVSAPKLYKNIFPYSEVPTIPFNDRIVPMHTPSEVWITDTSFRDGQQARAPYTVSQIVELYKFLNKLGGPNGMIRQTEFFLYTEKDQKAVLACKELDFKFPEITAWIRASNNDVELLKKFDILEAGVLTSISDYHIFKKMKLTRKQAFDQYCGIVKDLLSMGVRPRCHFEDITRADIYGFVIPLAKELMRLSKDANIPIKIRICDTLGLGVTYSGTSLPRSVQGIIYALGEYGGVPAEMMEWHGHNDFYKSVVNAGTAWLYGCAAVNCSLLGIGERTGNTPVEAMAFEYAQIFGNTNGMNLSVITEIKQFFENELKEQLPTNLPFIGKDFNTTRAGIHADGLMKDEEIYNIFDTNAILNRPFEVAITDKSGVAGISAWINVYFGLKEKKMIAKDNPGVKKIQDWVKIEYDQGRITIISDSEMISKVKEHLPDLYNEKVNVGQYLFIKEV
jgi:isopropylmalate/homocitrate/citramalate synthase